MTVVVKTNLPEFRRQMEKLGKDFIPLARRASLSAARELAKEVRQKAPKNTGRLRAAVVIKRARRVPRGSVHYIVGIRQGASAQRVQRRRGGKKTSVNLDAFYWRFLEQGWVPRRPGTQLQGGSRTKSLQARRARAAGGGVVRYPFIAPAFQSASGKALSAFYAKLDQETKNLK